MPAKRSKGQVIRFPVERRRTLSGPLDPSHPAIDLLQRIAAGLRQIESPRFRMTICIEGVEDVDP
jgi:hypothetical protein